MLDLYLIGVLSNIGMISFIALSAYLVLLVGEISFGQQAFFGIAAYASGIASAMWGWPFFLALVWGAALAGLAGLLLALPTLRIRGLYFAVASLAFAEMVRLLLEIFVYQIEIDGDLVGPNGSEGFRDIRYIYEADISNLQFMIIIYLLLAATMAVILQIERSRLGAVLRMVGEDPVLARLQGIDVRLCKVATVALAGLVAGIGGVLYAHLNTYIEPKIFNVMLGVHGLAYGLIGGLGTAFGPLLGVVLDIGVLESTRLFSGYRMIVFGGLVAVLLIFRPRGILDEVTLHRLGQLFSRTRRAGH